jgi:hypothetical protein
MSQVTNPNLNSQVRLKRWPPGRVAQLKLFLGHLEQAVGVSLASQVEQSPRRKFSEFVPKIVPQDITTDVSYREVRITFVEPKGLRNLLFYEYDISSTEGFFNIDRFNSPEPFFIWPNLTEGLTYYLRVRVVTKNGEVGPWSDTEAVTTPYTQNYGLYDGTEHTYLIKGPADTAFYPWLPVFERTYTAIGGKVYYAADYEVEPQRAWGGGTYGNGGRGGGNIEWCDVAFKWLEKLEGESQWTQKGQTFFTTTYATTKNRGNSGFYTFNMVTGGYDPFLWPSPINPDAYWAGLRLPGQWTLPRRGTFVQVLQEIPTGTHKFRLECKVLEHNTDIGDEGGKYPNEFVPVNGDEGGENGSKFRYGANVTVKIKNFNIFEALLDT